MAAPTPGATDGVVNGPFNGLNVPGYPQLANLMGCHGEVAIFRKFGALNALNLMSLQAELLDLEEELKDLFLTNEKSANHVFAQDFYEMRNDGVTGQELGLKMKLIREKLREYNATLLEVSQIASLPRPHKADLHFLRRWLKGSKPGEGDSFLRGIERDTWHEKIRDAEFITVDRTGAEQDAMTARVVDKLITWYNHYIGHRYKTPLKDSGVMEYTGLKTTTKYGVTIAASMLPALSVLGLYFVRNLLNRIWMMIGFTLVFAGALALGTSAKRVEIFSATAAFAAVEVVFIGSADLGKKS